MDENLGLISSLLAALRFIFVQTADQIWVDKLDLPLRIVKNTLDDFKQQMTTDGCDISTNSYEDSNIDVITSLLAAQRFIFVQSADQSWVDKLDHHFQIVKSLLDDFKQQIEVEECDNFDDEENYEIKEEIHSTNDENKAKEENSESKLKICTEVNSENIKKVACNEPVRFDEFNEIRVSHFAKIKAEKGASTRKKLPTCLICSEDFQTRNDLSKHDIDRHIEDGIFVCKVENCVKQFNSKINLLQHFRCVHSKSSDNICHECGEVFSSYGKLNYHVKSFHIKEKHTCEYCSKEFFVKDRLKQHIKFTHEEHANCEHCGLKVANKYNLASHIASIHKIGDPMKCSECDKVFLHRSHLTEHMSWVHKHPKRYMCDQCEYQCHSKAHLRRHGLSHTGDEAKLHECDECGVKFKHKGLLKAHIEGVHERRKNHNCKTCGKSFFSSARLKRHIKIHTGEMDFSCQYCDKKFNQKTNKDTHERKFHASLF